MERKNLGYCAQCITEISRRCLLRKTSKSIQLFHEIYILRAVSSATLSMLHDLQNWQFAIFFQNVPVDLFCTKLLYVNNSNNEQKKSYNYVENITVLNLVFFCCPLLLCSPRTILLRACNISIYNLTISVQYARQSVCRLFSFVSINIADKMLRGSIKSLYNCSRLICHVTKNAKPCSMFCSA